MADVNANIGVNIDSSQALSELKLLQRQLSEFNASITKSNAAAAAAQKSLQRNLIGSINSIGAFSAELRTVKTTAESFTDSLENNKFSMREYFRYAGAATKTFGQNFKAEFDTIGKVAEERVKTLQTQYIKMGRDASGAMKAIAIKPTTLDMTNLGTQTAIAAQKQAIFNQLLKQGSTNLLNFGKNTQWAGRQLMVGFTLPLAAFGAAAAKSFQQLETEVIKFKKVYGDLGTNPIETEAALKSIQDLADGYTKYGVAVSKTVGVASAAAAAGFKNADLIAQTDAATKLAILGQIDQQQALETTISLQNAFKISSTELASTIDFLNAVENQTVTSLDDITTAIPKVAPVIQSLGGDVKDLAFFLTAMKEGGVNASEGANALKSGLASLINPSNKANDLLASMGININNIVTKNRGNLKATVVEFAKELDKLDPLSRARAIETMFGKFQFARISTLLSNVIDSGNQASRVLDLAGQSASDLAGLTAKELGVTAESALIRFQGAVAKLQASLAPVGEVFMNALVPVLDFISGLLDKFNNLGDGTKKFIAVTVGVIGGLGPVLLMTFGLLANGLANILKLFSTLRAGYQRLTGQSQTLGTQTQYLTTEQMEASAAAHSLEQSHARLTQQFTVEATAVNSLRRAYQNALAAGASFASLNPGMMKMPKKFATGGIFKGPGNGTSDSIPAMVSNGEAIIPAKTVQKYPGMVAGLIRGNVKGFADGFEPLGKGFKNATMFIPESWNTKAGSQGQGIPTAQLSEYLSKAGRGSMMPLVAAMAKRMQIDIRGPEFKKQFMDIADEFSKTAVTALNNSGKQFIKDEDLESIVVPALKKTATKLNVSGREVSTALNQTIDEIHTVGPVGAQSGTKGGGGRTAVSRFSYIRTRKIAQDLAIEANPEMFVRDTRVSSKGSMKSTFKTLNTTTKQFEVAHMAHLTKSITTSVKNITTQTAAYLGDVGEKIVKATSKSINDGAKKGLKIASPSKETEYIGNQASKGLTKGLEKTIPDAKISGEKLGNSVVAGVRKTARVATRAQGAPPNIAQGAAGANTNIIPVVSSKDKDKGKTKGKPKVNAKTVGKGLSGKGVKITPKGGLAAMGATMVLDLVINALPDFKGKDTTKSVVGGAATGASVGMFFGPGGAAIGGVAGALIGGLSKVVGDLNAETARLKAMSEATWKPSASLAEYFGNSIKETDIKLQSFNVKTQMSGKYVQNLSEATQTTTKDLTKFKALLESLPEDDPLKAMVAGLKDLADGQEIKAIAEGFIILQVASGALKPEEAQKTLDLLLASSDHLAMVGSTFIDIESQADAVTRSLERASKQIEISGSIINSAAMESETLGNALLVVMDAARNATSLEELEAILKAVDAAGLDATKSLEALYRVYFLGGNTQSAKLARVLQEVEGATAKTLIDIQVATEKGINIDIFNGATAEDIYAQIDAGYKKIGDAAFAAEQKIGAADKAQIKKNEAYLKTLEARKSLIDQMLKKEQKISDEFKRQNELRQTQQSLDQKIIQAKLRGNYVEAQILQDEQQSNAVMFENDTMIGALQEQSDKIAEQISKIEKNTQALEDNVRELKANTKAIKNFKPGTVSYGTQAQNAFSEPDEESWSDGGWLGSPTIYSVFLDPMTQKYVQIKSTKANLAEDYMGAVAKGYVFSKYATNGINPKVAKVYKNADELPFPMFYNVGTGKWEAMPPTGMATGGHITGPGTGTSDSIPAYLSNGEYVVKASAVKQYGTGFLDNVNAQRFATGGSVQADKNKSGSKSFIGGIFSGIKNFFGSELTPEQVYQNAYLAYLNEYEYAKGNNGWTKNALNRAKKTNRLNFPNVSEYPTGNHDLRIVQEQEKYILQQLEKQMNEAYRNMHGYANGGMVNIPRFKDGTPGGITETIASTANTGWLGRFNPLNWFGNMGSSYVTGMQNYGAKQVDYRAPEYKTSLNQTEKNAIVLEAAKEISMYNTVGKIVQGQAGAMDYASVIPFIRPAKKIAGAASEISQAQKVAQYEAVFAAREAADAAQASKMLKIAKDPDFYILENFINRPLTAYGNPALNEKLLKFFAKYDLNVPSGLETFRGLSEADMIQLSKLKVGDIWSPGVIKSFTNDPSLAADAASFGSKTGGGMTDSIAKIETMRNVPGIKSTAEIGRPTGIAGEGLFGPGTRYKIVGITKAQHSDLHPYRNVANIEDFLKAKWNPVTHKTMYESSLATATPLTYLLQAFKDGGMVNVPKFHDWNGVVPGPYGQEVNAVLKAGTEGVYQNQYIAGLKNAAAGNTSTSNANTVYNIDMTVNGGSANANDIANQVMKKLQVVASQNNKTNKVVV